MKKYLVVLLSILLLLTIACGNKESESPEKEEVEVAIEEGEIEKEVESKEDTEELGTEDYYETEFWKAIIPKDWKKDEDKSSDDDKIIVFNSGNGEEIAKVSINNNGYPNDIRIALEEQRWSQIDFIDKNVEGGIYIGEDYGIIFPYYSDLKALARNVPKNTNIEIILTGDTLSTEGETMLESFTLLTEDVGHVDPPYAHEGEDLSPTTGEVSIGDYKFSAEYLKLNPIIPTYETFNVYGEQNGNYFYLIKYDELYIYDMNDGMKLVKTEIFPDQYKGIATSPNGKTYITESYSDSFILEGTELSETELGTTNRLTLHPSGTWGIEHHFTIDDINRVTINEDGTVTTEAIAFIGEDGNPVQKMAANLFILEEKIAIPGNMADDSGYVLGIYNMDGTLDKVLRNKEDKNLGSISGVIEGRDTYFAADANLRAFYLWDKSGNFLGEIDDKDILGTSYPWMAKFFKGVDGNNYLVGTEEREDKSSKEVIVYKINTNL